MGTTISVRTVRLVIALCCRRRRRHRRRRRRRVLFRGCRWAVFRAAAARVRARVVWRVLRAVFRTAARVYWRRRRVRRAWAHRSRVRRAWAPLPRVALRVRVHRMARRVRRAWAPRPRTVRRVLWAGARAFRARGRRAGRSHDGTMY